jgi:hypothetical protein
MTWLTWHPFAPTLPSTGGKKRLLKNSVFGDMILSSPIVFQTFRSRMLPSFSGSKCRSYLSLTSLLAYIIVTLTEDGSSTFLRNVGKLLSDHKASHHRREHSLWELHTRQFFFSNLTADFSLRAHFSPKVVPVLNELKTGISELPSPLEMYVWPASRRSGREGSTCTWQGMRRGQSFLQHSVPIPTSSSLSVPYLKSRNILGWVYKQDTDWCCSMKTFLLQYGTKNLFFVSVGCVEKLKYVQKNHSMKC